MALQKAKGDWIVFLEADDTIEPNYIELKLDVIKKFPNIKFIFNDVHLIGDLHKILKYQELLKHIKQILNKYIYPVRLFQYFSYTNVVPTFSCVMLKKEIMKRIDYNVEFKPLLDW